MKGGGVVPHPRRTEASWGLYQRAPDSHSHGRRMQRWKAVILVATLWGPMMFARIGVMRALNRHVERVLDTSRSKDRHWGRRKLKRDE
jgi:hypothetical protein